MATAPAILELVFVPLAWHCLAAGNAGRAFYYILESVAGYLHVSNSYMVCCCMNCIKLAMKMIREALSLLERYFTWCSFGAFLKSQVEKLPCAAFVRRAAFLPQEIVLSAGLLGLPEVPTRPLQRSASPQWHFSVCPLLLWQPSLCQLPFLQGGETDFLLPCFPPALPHGALCSKSLWAQQCLTCQEEEAGLVALALLLPFLTGAAGK